MSRLPALSGRECVKVLEKAGFYFLRQKGSHISLAREEPFAQVVVPDHKELDRGALRAIIRQSGLSVDEFIDLLNG
jgi:predicted RNA binding protein YcfA (HicA-like mRNA interferase family)